MNEMNNEMSVFDSLESTPATPATPVNTEAADAKKAKIEAMKAALKETMDTDKTYVERLRTMSKNVEVINSLGFGENGGLIVDKAKSTKDDRVLIATSAIVGYRLKNIGDQPIQYRTEVWTQGEDGKFVAQKVEKVLVPGGTCDLNRANMTAFCAQPEFSFQLANGKVIRGAGNKSSRGDLKAELEAYYFSFDKSLNLQINADEVKLNVGEKVGDKWVVKAEFVETFGYLNNAPEKTRSKKESGTRFNASDMAANYVMKMINNSSL